MGAGSKRKDGESLLNERSLVYDLVFLFINCGMLFKDNWLSSMCLCSIIFLFFPICESLCHFIHTMFCHPYTTHVMLLMLFLSLANTCNEH